MAGSAQPPADAAAVTATKSASSKSTGTKSGFAPWAAAEQRRCHATHVTASGFGADPAGTSLSYLRKALSERQNVLSLTPLTQTEEDKVTGSMVSAGDILQHSARMLQETVEQQPPPVPATDVSAVSLHISPIKLCCLLNCWSFPPCTGGRKHLHPSTAAPQVLRKACQHSYVAVTLCRSGRAATAHTMICSIPLFPQTWDITRSSDGSPVLKVLEKI